MRTADLKPDTAYATCDGVYVVPLEPIHAEYQPVREKDGGVTIVSLKEPEVPPTDPWGKCHTVQPKVRHRVGTKGIKCATFTVDRDGKPIEDTRREVVVKPADISGDWKTYLTLYAHVVREKADEREREDREKKMAKAIEATLASVPGQVSVSLASRRWGNRTPNASITFKFEPPRTGKRGDTTDELDLALAFANEVAALYTKAKSSRRKKA